MKKVSLMLLCLLFGGNSILYAQTQITGTVTSSEDGEPLPGVSVVVKGTTTGTSTDVDGNYSLEVPEDVGVLTFSYVGYANRNVTIEGQNVIDVALEPDVVGLDEVVVTAYGTSKKASFTGSASTIDNEKLEDRQVTSVTELLQGNSAGVQVLSTVGQPGQNASVRIRGIGSVNASSEPLYVVDGVPFDGNVNSIQTSDIETFTVLKDANATALFGSRGANGVIMITTKQGQAGKPRANFKASYGISSKAVEDYETVNAREYYELIWEGIKNGLVQEGNSESEAAETASQDVTTYLVYNSFDDPAPIGADGRIKPGTQELWQTDWMDVAPCKIRGMGIIRGVPIY